MLDSYPGILIRSVCVYLFLVLALRLFGRKELSQLSTADLVFIVLISNSVQNAMVGSDSSLWGGLIAATALFGVNYLFKLLLFKSPSIKDMVEDKPVILIHNGKLDHQHLWKLKISEDEIEEAVREHGLDDHTQVKLAILEVDGNISVLSGDNNKLKQTHFKRKRRHKTLISS